jgi:hypothetical protein
MPATTTVSELDRLEAESIHVMREVAASTPATTSPR